MEKRENRKTRYTKMVLRETLMEFMKTRPISDISIKELCAAADISRTTFYIHYRDQHDLLRQIEEDTLVFIDEAMNKYDFIASTGEAVQMMKEILGYVSNNTSSMQVLLGEYGNSNFQKTLFAFVPEKILGKIPHSRRRRTISGKPIDPVDRDYRFASKVNTTIGLIQHWLKNNMNKSIQELAEMIIDLIYPRKA